MDGGYIGEVRLFAGNFAPRAWAFCEGQLLPISQNSALFSIIGTIYGGDGRTTLALPDLRGRVPIGPGRGPGLPSYREGQMGGAYEVTQTTSEMANHTHSVVKSGSTTMASTMYVSSADGDHAIPTANSVIAKAVDLNGDPVNLYNSQTPDITLNSSTITNQVTSEQNLTIAPNGGQQQITNMQPFTSIYYIICLQGIFPSRN